MARRLTTEDFIEKAKAVHGDRYDYSQVAYVNNGTKVTIICSVHGPFLQTPKNHLKTKGCPECAPNRRLTTESFISKAKEIHGDRFDYSKVTYEKSAKKVTIICPDHGAFEQEANSHLQGAGCPRCAGRTVSTEFFVEKAESVHAGRYNYSKVEYSNPKTKVTINCFEHGPFEQTPNDHLSGCGCPICGRLALRDSRLLTTVDFVDRATGMHGERYNYSQVEYETSQTKVTIICRDHGPFEQTPNNHLRGQGCPDCGRLAQTIASRRTKEEFTDRARKIHGDRYDYSLVEYQGANVIVEIVCPDHGIFNQTPGSHLAGRGCPDCGNIAIGDSLRQSVEEFIEKARAVHGDRYDYLFVEYQRSVEKVIIICPDHGPFHQAPGEHASGKGCPACAPNAPLNTKSFIERAKEIHGSRYDYSQVAFINSQTNVTIICPEHGPFQQNPSNHIHVPTGCPDCAEYGFNPNDRATLYYLAITTDDGDTRYKIGITNRTVKKRFSARADLARIRIVKTWNFEVGRIAGERESEILRQYAGDRYYGPDILQSGNTELFTHDILGLDKDPE